MDGDVDFSPDSESVSMDMTASEPAPSAVSATITGTASQPVEEQVLQEGSFDMIDDIGSGSVESDVDYATIADAPTESYSVQTVSLGAAGVQKGFEEGVGEENYYEYIARVADDPAYYEMFAEMQRKRQGAPNLIDSGAMQEIQKSSKLSTLAQKNQGTDFSKICAGLAASKILSVQSQLAPPTTQYSIPPTSQASHATIAPPTTINDGPSMLM